MRAVHHPPACCFRADTGALDREAVERFLRDQDRCLRQGLRHATSRDAVARVLSAHDASHPSWLLLIATVKEARGDAAARVLSALYTHHGRVAGSLERGPDPRLSGAVCVEVRALLEDRLAELTDAAVGVLSAPPGPAAV